MIFVFDNFIISNIYLLYNNKYHIMDKNELVEIKKGKTVQALL